MVLGFRVFLGVQGLGFRTGCRVEGPVEISGSDSGLPFKGL